MRPSNRAAVLDATWRVVERGGISSVTYEAVAAEAGLTKAGIVYHFPSRDDLIHALQQHLAGRWDSALRDKGGADPEELSDQQKLRAYVETATSSATTAELLLILEAATDPDLSRPWNDVVERWTPPLPTAPLPEDRLRQIVAMLAADGLWMHEALKGKKFSDETRRELAAFIGKVGAGRENDPGASM